MSAMLDPYLLHAYVDGELAPEDAAMIERAMADDPAVAAEVAALREHRRALHARYDTLLAPAPHLLPEGARLAGVADGSGAGAGSSRRWAALAASVLIAAGLGVAAGWVARGGPTAGTAPDAVAENRLRDFARVASVSHAVFVPEVRHPVEVAAAEEAHLVAWLSKRLDAPLKIPALGDAGFALLGGRLLPADSGPVAQFMYQDAQKRRLTLAVSRGVTGAQAPAMPSSDAAFRISESGGNTTFYWMDADHAYALTGALPRAELTAVAGIVHRQLDR